MIKDLLKISEEDSVALALEDIQPGDQCKVNDFIITAADEVPRAHKIALCDIPVNSNVVKYGLPIGHATRDIRKGEHVHIHNMTTNLQGLLKYSYHRNDHLWDKFHNGRQAYFDGYMREDGRAGTRNEIWIVPTTSCVNRTAEILAEKANKKYAGRIDGVRALTHTNGCSQLGDDLLITQHVLKGLIQNPNAGAVLVLSLGCENNCLKYFKPVLGEVNPDRVKFLVTQDVDDEYTEGMRLLDQLEEYVESFQRQKISAELLQIGLKCGSSDPFSGISANPLCGRITDRVVECGGKAILTEVSEMFGAETRLMDRAADEETFHKIVRLINDFKSYFIRYNQPIDRNPAPGNIESGITTDEDKALGNIQKGGSAPVTDVLSYGEQATRRGLNLLIGSGNDPISVTNLVASGCNIILFSTGNGNPFGSVVPTIKIASNTSLMNRKKQWIDFNAGKILDGASFDEVTDELFAFLLDTASGKIRTKNEEYGYEEIAIFKDGVIL